MRGGRAEGDSDVRGRGRQGHFYAVPAGDEAEASDEPSEL